MFSLTLVSKAKVYVYLCRKWKMRTRPIYEVHGGSLLVYGLQRPMNLGYRQHVRTECCLQIHAMNRSKPRPYPPWGEVPYLQISLAFSD